MKKLLALLLALFGVLSLSACGSGNGGGGTTVPSIPNPSESYDGKILIAYFSMTEVIDEGADAVSSATPYD